MRFKDKKTSFFGLLAAGFLLAGLLFKKRRADIKQELAGDLSTGSSRRNVRLNEKIRSRFRRNWLTYKPKDTQ
jgi:hypothetical protein